MRVPESTPFTSIPCGVCPGTPAAWHQPDGPAACMQPTCCHVLPLPSANQHTQQLLPKCLPSLAHLAPLLPLAMPAVFNECSEEGKITPKTCVYYQQWLEF